MADWQGDAIILSGQRHGESSLILSVLSRQHGRSRGLVRGAANSKQRGLYEPGNQVTAAWNARLSEQLGALRIEPLRQAAAGFMDDALRLACLSAALALADLTLPERSAHPATYDALTAVLDALIEHEAFPTTYLRYELVLLAELGFGLALDRCAVTGAKSELAYVSPRTGRAVSFDAGAPYRERLLLLPTLLGGVIPAEDETDDIIRGLRLSGYFLERHALSGAMPATRAIFQDRLARNSAIS